MSIMSLQKSTEIVLYANYLQNVSMSFDLCQCPWIRDYGFCFCNNSVSTTHVNLVCRAHFFSPHEWCDEYLLYLLIGNIHHCEGLHKMWEACHANPDDGFWSSIYWLRWILEVVSCHKEGVLVCVGSFQQDMSTSGFLSFTGNYRPKIWCW